MTESGGAAAAAARWVALLLFAVAALGAAAADRGIGDEVRAALRLGKDKVKQVIQPPRDNVRGAAPCPCVAVARARGGSGLFVVRRTP